MVAGALSGAGCASDPPRSQTAWPVVSVPSRADATLAARYRALGRQVEDVRSTLGRVTAAADACARSATSTVCETAVEDAGRAVNELHVLLTRMRFVCKSQDPDTQALERASNEQVDFAGERLDEAARALDSIVGERFEEARARADQANPVPAPHYHCHGHW